MVIESHFVVGNVWPAETRRQMNLGLRFHHTKRGNNDIYQGGLGISGDQWRCIMI